MGGELLLHKLVERLLELLAANGEIGLFTMTERRNASWLLNHDQVVIDVSETNIRSRRGRRSGVVKNLHDIARFHLPLAVEAQIPVHLNAATGDQLADLVPRLIRQQSLQGGSQRLMVVLGREME